MKVVLFLVLLFQLHKLVEDAQGWKLGLENPIVWNTYGEEFYTTLVMGFILY